MLGGSVARSANVRRTWPGIERSEPIFWRTWPVLARPQPFFRRSCPRESGLLSPSFSNSGSMSANFRRAWRILSRFRPLFGQCSAKVPSSGAISGQIRCGFGRRVPRPDSNFDRGKFESSASRGERLQIRPCGKPPTRLRHQSCAACRRSPKTDIRRRLQRRESDGGGNVAATERAKDYQVEGGS